MPILFPPRAVPAPGGSASDPDTSSVLASVLERDMGIKLVTKKAPVDTLVIDHIEEKPTEN